MLCNKDKNFTLQTFPTQNLITIHPHVAIITPPCLYNTK